MDLNLKDFQNILSEGLIAVNKEGTIEYYNNKAKDIIGISRNCHFEHPQGQLNPGDIVLLAVTGFSGEDGGLVAEDLETIGIHDVFIEKGSALLAVGTYKDDSEKGYCKFKDSKTVSDSFSYEGTYKNVEFNCKIDYYLNYVSISVDEWMFATDYNDNFGHIVILDGKTKAVKFYQKNGYSAWGEDIKSLLSGTTFSKKTMGRNDIDVVGRHILDFHSETQVMRDLIACANGKDIKYSQKLSRINGIAVNCGINHLIRDNQLVGAVLAVSDITRLKNIENQKNIVSRKLEKVSAELGEKELLDELFPNIIGSSNAITKIKKLAYKASKTNSNVLILGESGTGKSILARGIHNAEKNPKKPFIQVNCNSIPENLLESELFGYEKGAFTGANNKGKKGYFEMANGGTIFLDEIGEISKNMQVKLLQAIQNKAFYKVGGNTEVKVNVRIIVATNRNLEEDVKDGLFREDLYYRINVFPINLPPLRERSEDIYELTDYLLPKIASRVGIKKKRITGEGLNKLMLYNWPGNIRELENILERAVNISEETSILSTDLMIDVDSMESPNAFNYIRPLKETVQMIETEAIKQVMDFADGNKSKAMDILKIKKTALYDKLKKYNL